MRRRRNSAFLSIAACQHLGYPIAGLFTFANGCERSAYVADHVLQKSICRNFKRNPVTVAHNGQFRNIAMGCIGPATRCPERRKVVFADEVLASLVHAPVVKRRINPPGAMPTKGRAFKSIQNAVTIIATGCGKTRVKLVSNVPGPGNADVVRQIAIHSEQPTTIVARAWRIEVDDLSSGVNARVGPAGTSHLNRMVGDLVQGFLETLLHTEACVLALPTIVRRTVVLNTERNAHGFARPAT